MPLIASLLGWIPERLEAGKERVWTLTQSGGLGDPEVTESLRGDKSLLMGPAAHGTARAGSQTFSLEVTRITCHFCPPFMGRSNKSQRPEPPQAG